MTDTVIARFEGDGSGVAELSWGQHEIWCVPASGGLPQQVVHARGEISLEVVEAGDGDPAEAAAAVTAGYMTRTFNYEDEWPARMAVITHQGAATHVAEIYCHLAIDGFGLAALRKDLTSRDRTGPAPAPVTAMHWEERNDVPADKAFLSVNDTPDALCYEFQADSHFVSPADMAALMRRIEAVLVDAAVRDTAFEGAALGGTAGGGTRAVPAMGAVR